MRIQYNKIVASILFVLISFVSQAQVLPPPPGPPPPPGLPIDGGILVMIVIGLLYGVKKTFKN